MIHRNERYECVFEPTGACMIWDKFNERPAELANPLICLSEKEAHSMCWLMNRIIANAAAAPTFRQ